MDKQTRSNHTNIQKYAIDLFLNFLIIFLSYILAALIRYYIFKPLYTLNPFALPFLIIIMIYSAFMAITLDYEEFPRVLQGKEVYSGIYQIVTKNVIGCLVLSTVFATGIMNFSRWALFLFWLISTGGLIIKRVSMYSITAQKRCAGEDVRNVVIVGEGKLAEDYIRAITKNPQFGIHIKGYYGPDDRLQTNLEGWFEQEKYPFPVIRWLGEYDAAKIREAGDIDEIIVADINDSEAPDIMNELVSTGIKVSMALPYSSYISHGSRTRDLGEAKLIRANEDNERKKYSKAGLVVSIALLFIILLIKRFNLTSMETIYTMAGIEKMRSVLFAVLAYFLSSILSDKLAGKRHGMLKSAVISLLCCTAFVLLYEWAYRGPFWQSVLVDLVPSLVVIIVFFGIKETVRAFARSFVGA